MEMVVKGRHMQVTPAIHDYAQEKIGRIDKILENLIMEIEVELSSEKNPKIENSHVAEVTVRTKGHVIRAKEAAADMYAALDLVSEKLETQARKLKGKLKDRHSGKNAQPPVAVAPPGVPEPVIAKTKKVSISPMSPEDAVLQMELLGHDFFIFATEETEQVRVLYRRDEGDYGLLEPRVG